MARTKRDGDRDNKSGAKPQADEADGQHDNHGFEQRFREAGNGVLHDERLIRDKMDPDTDRQIGHDLRHLLFQRFAELKRLAPVFIPMARAIAGCPLKRTNVFGGSAYPRVILATLVSGKKRSLTRRLIAFRLSSDVKLSADADADALGSRLEHAGGRDGVLSLQRSDDCAAVEAKRRDLPG